ncbi:Sfi1 spindle body family protein [Aspergillus niger]|uniref:Sfi1 spindle body family protein n=1 Tax=Aspergillus niger TaxID=5061 RepID=A0A505HR78_ASPNG|nr:Sfi1 spindle body family protein [Aspergillus niger]
MFMHPAARKGLITEPTSIPYLNYQDPVCIQDDQILDYSQETALHFLGQQQPRLQTPFQYQPDLQFVSPPSSAPSSPTSSPASTISHYPATTAVAADYSSAVFDGNSFEAPSMTPSSSYNPSINIHHSASPPSQAYLPQYTQPYYFNGNPMLAQQSVANNHGWEGNLQLLGPARLQNNLLKASASPSSSRSAPAGSSYSRTNGVAKPLPTPVQTPVQTFQDAPSVSSVSHNSPVTPHTGFEDLDDASKAIVNGENRFPDVDKWMDDYLRLDALSDYTNHNANNNMTIGIPKLNRTISDIYQDELYNPAMMSTPQMAKPATNQQNLLTPSFRNVIADRLQAANQGHLTARSQSPMVSMPRDRSPFRQNSPLAAEYNHAALQQPQMATSAPTSQNGVNMGQAAQGEPKTMSPKDALLDFNEGDDTGLPLFPPSSQPDFNLGDALGGLRRESSGSFQPTQNFTSMESFPSHDVLPSTEMTSPQASAKMPMQAPPVKEEISRPENTSADGGTYTCTYHGCTLRFETPAKLQKHKREAHRQTTPGGHLVTRDTSARNSQAGPHKCERINPSTGKPCNSVFSRPYDLTRHEDTIHNARKQKVRCHLCTEEKTFSRNDALTRHMRVVHPEVDWPGKQRRRGRE